MQCPNCKRTIQPGSRTCAFCGQPLPARRRGSMLLVLGAAAIFIVFFAGGLALIFLRGPRSASPPAAIAATATLGPTTTTALAAATATQPPSPTDTPLAATPTTPATAAPAAASPAPTRAIVIPPTPTLSGALPPAPACATPVSPELASLWQARYAQLGCPTGPAGDVWAAWQEYEHGAMLWRSDTKQITIFYEDGRQQTVADTWDGKTVYNDTAPAGLMAPERGFAWVWHSQSGAQDRLGWAIRDELGFCAQLQPFEQGFAFVSTGRPCSNELNRAREPGFAPLSIVVLNAGSWTRN